MEYELFGAITNANSYEQAKQLQFAYFKNASSKNFMKYNATSTEATYVLLGSAFPVGSSNFCISKEGSPYDFSATYSLALVSVFKT
jgi:hypothetical protein